MEGIAGVDEDCVRILGQRLIKGGGNPCETNFGFALHDSGMRVIGMQDRESDVACPVLSEDHCWHNHQQCSQHERKSTQFLHRKPP